MTSMALSLVVFSALACLAKAEASRRAERLAALAGVPRDAGGRQEAAAPIGHSAVAGLRSARHKLAPSALALVGGLVGMRLAGPLGVIVGASVGAAVPVALDRRRRRRRAEALERQLAEFVEACALAVRSGLSVAQAMEFGAGETAPPLGEVLARFRAKRALGTPFEHALEHLGEVLATDDAKLFCLVMSVHARSGGNLAGALEEVTATIRHRIGVRRELRALSAQGRISGTVLGVLPIAFFLLLATTSHRELGPVYRSPAGVAMVASGLVMQALAYLWIRKLMRVEV